MDFRQFLENREPTLLTAIVKFSLNNQTQLEKIVRDTSGMLAAAGFEPHFHKENYSRYQYALIGEKRNDTDSHLLTLLLIRSVESYFHDDVKCVTKGQFAAYENTISGKAHQIYYSEFGDNKDDDHNNDFPTPKMPPGPKGGMAKNKQLSLSV